jgi:hypothetical protein
VNSNSTMTSRFEILYVHEQVDPVLPGLSRGAIQGISGRHESAFLASRAESDPHRAGD